MNFANVKYKLSAMMFVQFFIWGSWYVTMGTYLGETLPFQWNSNRSRLRNSSNCFHDFAFYRRYDSRPLLLCQSCDGISEYCWSRTACMVINYRRFFLFFPVLIIYSICYMPTTALCNSISFFKT